MSDGLTTPTDPELLAPPTKPRRSAWVVVPAQALVVVVLFAAVGAALGRLWFRLWHQPTGTVAQGQWYTSEAGLRDDFQGVAWYVALGILAGLVLGLLCAYLLVRSELATLAALVAGSVLAAYLMYKVGTHYSPADPQRLAVHAKDGTKLKGALTVSSWPPRAAFPFGALLGAAIVYGLTAGRAPRQPQPDAAVVADPSPRG